MALDVLDDLGRLNGMFGVAVWDERNRRLMLARDRMGEKPLYYRLGNGHWSFASELNTLAGTQQLTPSPAAAVQFLVAIKAFIEDPGHMLIGG